MIKFLIRTLIIVSFVILLHACPSTTEIDLPDSIIPETIPLETDDIIIITDNLNDTGTTDTGQPVLCRENEACNSLLNQNNYCEKECIFQPDKCTCEGNIINSLCYLFDIPQKPDTKNIIDGIRIVPPDIPQKIFVGDRLELRLTLINTENTEKMLTINYKNPSEWEIFPQNFSNNTTITFQPQETKELVFNANALMANVFLIGYKPIITFNIPYELYGDIFYNRQDNYLFCNNNYFPPSYCEYEDCSSYNRYSSAVCCEDIFYPAASCCSDVDCSAGSKCVDGRCIFRSPALFLANTTLIQNNRILVILSDIESIPEENLCTNKAEQLRELLQLDIIEDYYKKIVYNRTHQTDIIHFRWEILAGYRSENFIHNGDYTFLNFKKSLQNYLNNSGCNIDFSEYDKLIIMSPKMDLQGFAGMAFGNGDIGTIIYSNGYLTAHELAHSFGATDLYLELGGRFQYALALMANNFSWGFPQDKVTWGEIGLGDINSNGIIDLFEFARFPEGIEVDNVRAYLTRKESVEISFDLWLLEEGLKKRGIFLENIIELPEYSIIQDLYQETQIAFDKYQVDLERLKQEKRIAVRLKTRYRFSNKDYKNVVLNFDRTFDVPITEQQ